MLKLDFINVGDGDAILIREREPGGEEFVMLVDCGRPHIDFKVDSKRTSALNYLMRAGVGHIDLLVLTHLHFDHIGGAAAILRHIPVKRILAGYLPPRDAGWIFAPKCNVKTVVGLCDALNLFQDIIADARARGTECAVAQEGGGQLTKRLSMHMLRPDDALAARQAALFDGLYHGRQYEVEDIRLVSSERNCSSLIVRLLYGSRSILLTGDSYAAYWQDSVHEGCDILKLPHHGDAKSMTEALIRKLAPTYAVVSCQNDIPYKKERPAAHIVEMMQRYVPHILCTENRPLPTLEAAVREAVRFTITEDGALHCLEPS